MGERTALVALVLLGVPAGALGQAPPNDEPPRDYVNLRVGASSADQNRRPQLCAEASPFAFLSVEACGTGAGFLHREPEPELAHFRAKLRALAFRVDAQWLELFAAAGFAELQIGADEPGFAFGGTDARRVATAGPEGGLALRMPVELEGDFELLVDANLSLAWIPHADELVVPQSELQPSASITFGVGF